MMWLVPGSNPAGVDFFLNKKELRVSGLVRKMDFGLEASVYLRDCRPWLLG